MTKFFTWLRNLRRYFFLRIAVWACFLNFFIKTFYVYIPIPSYIDEHDYYQHLIDNVYFELDVLAGLCLFLFFIELIFRYLIGLFIKFVLKKEIKPFKTHKNKYLMMLDNIYTIIFLIIIVLDLLALLACCIFCYLIYLRPSQ